MLVLGEYEIQMGKFLGQTFRWIVENAVGYTAWLMHNTTRETASTSDLSRNKHALKDYVLSFPDLRPVVESKAPAQKAAQRSAMTAPAVKTATSPLSFLLKGRTLTAGSLHARVKSVLRHTASPQARPRIPHRSPARSSSDEVGGVLSKKK